MFSTPGRTSVSLMCGQGFTEAVMLSGKCAALSNFFLFKTKGSENQWMDVCIAENVILTHVEMENCFSLWEKTGL